MTTIAGRPEDLAGQDQPYGLGERDFAGRAIRSSSSISSALATSMFMISDDQS